MSTNHEAVAALPVTGSASKALVRAMSTRRFAYCLDESESASDFVAVDPAAGTVPLYLIQGSTLFRYDALDTTTSGDGLTCLVTNDGKRYKVQDISFLVGLITFADILGTVVPSQLPLPTATTLGGVKSLAAVAHNWINSISTTGQPLASQPAASDLSNGVTGSGSVVLANAPAVVGGSHTALTGLSIRSTGAAFDLSFQTNEGLTASHYINWACNNADRGINLAGNLTFAGNFTTVGGNFTATLTGTTTVTFPTAGTLATLAGSETLTNKGINATNNTVSNLTTAMFATSVVDTDGTLAANSDTRFATQKAVKTYVDTVAQGLDAKQSVLVATTANLTLSGEQTIDGALTSASRVLVKNQTTASQNGIYVSGSGAWVRATDADAWTELPGAFVFVEKGAINGDCGFVCTVDAGGTIGTTTVAFTQFSGAGAYTAGTGLTQTGTQFAIDSTVATLTGAQAIANKISYNKVAIIAPTTGATLTIPDGVTLTGPAASGTAMTLGNAETITGQKTFSGGYPTKWSGAASGDMILFGGVTLNGTNTPNALNLGGDYSATAGANPKIKLLGVPGSIYGLGVSNGLMEFMAPTSAGYAFNVNGSAVVSFSTTGAINASSFTGGLAGATGLPIATGVAGLALGVATFLSAPSSANLAASLTDKTGTGANVFADSPALTGAPTTPTAVTSDNSTKIASTAYVTAKVAAVTAGVAQFNGLTGSVTSSVVVRTFTASGTYTPTAGMLHAIVECVGGGGAGGGATSVAGSQHTGGGGGAGGWSRKMVTATDIGASKTITIGAAGTAAAGTNGGNGADTSLSTLCIAKGGTGGTGGVNGVTFGTGGSGGVSGTGDASSSGMPGGSGFIGTTSVFGPSGMGGSSSYGGGGKSIVGGADQGGAGATGYGGGGSGALSFNAATSIAGGNGSAGVVIITEFINL